MRGGYLSRSGRMKRRNRWLVPYITAVVALVIRLWMSTMRVKMVSADGRGHPADPEQTRYIYAFWHEGLLSDRSRPGPKSAFLSVSTPTAR